MVAFLIWQYLTKFFSLSKEIIDEMAVSVFVNGLELNDSYLSLSESLGIIGPIFLLLLSWHATSTGPCSRTQGLEGYSTPS